MSFFENTRKPVGFSGKIMVAMMNFGHSAMAAWGLHFLQPAPDAMVLDCGCTAVCTAGLCRRRPLPCAVPKASANSQKHTTPAHKSAKFFRSIPVPPCAMSLAERVCRGLFV